MKRKVRFTTAGLLCPFAALLGLVSVAHATQREWTGNQPRDNTWTTPQNLVVRPPVAGDDLVFPSAARHPNKINDFPSGTTFNSIELRGGGSPNYDIGGNSIALNAGLAVDNNSGTPNDHTFRNSFPLNSNQTFTVNNPFGSLSLLGPIDLTATT